MEENKLTTQLDKQYLLDKANLGTEQVDQEDIPTPTLLLTQDISKVVNEKGEKIPAGKLYYSGTGEVFEKLDVTFLVLTKKDTPDYKTKEPTRTHIYLGVIHPTLMPFLMWFKNTALFTSKQFLGRLKAMKVPMFTLNVTLTPEKTSFGTDIWWKTRFEITGMKQTMEEMVILEDLIHQYAPNLESEITKADELEKET